MNRVSTSTRLLLKFHLFAKMIFLGIYIGKFFNHIHPYAFKVCQSIFSKIIQFSKQSKFRKESFLKFLLIFIICCSIEGNAIFVDPNSAAVLAVNLNKKIEWEKDYDRAVQRSLNEDKLLFMLFTGLEWSPSSAIFKEEIVDSPLFSKLFSEKFVFLNIDLPISQALAFKQIEIRQELLRSYHVEGIPTAVLLNPQLQTLGMSGDGAVDVNTYASYVSQVLLAYQELSEGLKKMDNPSLAVSDLKKMYQIARKMGLQDQSKLILEEGLKREDPSSFFLAEQYRELLEMGEFDSPRVEKARMKLLATQDNELQLYLAGVEFQALSSSNSMDLHTAEPLLNYLGRFGDKDSASNWRINMILAQFFYSAGEFSRALGYASKAYGEASEVAKEDVFKFISKIEVKNRTEAPQLFHEEI